MKDGYYVVYARKEGTYRLMTDEKASLLATLPSMRQIKPTTSAGYHLIDLCTNAKTMIPKVHRRFIRDPFLIRGKDDGHFVCFGPVKDKYMELHLELGTWDAIFEEIDSRLQSSSLIEVNIQNTHGKPRLLSWRDNVTYPLSGDDSDGGLVTSESETEDSDCDTVYSEDSHRADKEMEDSVDSGSEDGSFKSYSDTEQVNTSRWVHYPSSQHKT